MLQERGERYVILDQGSWKYSLLINDIHGADLAVFRPYEDHSDTQDCTVASWVFFTRILRRETQAQWLALVLVALRKSLCCSPRAIFFAG